MACPPAGATPVRVPLHERLGWRFDLDELRAAIAQVYTACGQAVPAWTDASITANATKSTAYAHAAFPVAPMTRPPMTGPTVEPIVNAKIGPREQPVVGPHPDPGGA